MDKKKLKKELSHPRRSKETIRVPTAEIEFQKLKKTTDDLIKKAQTKYKKTGNPNDLDM